MSYVLKVIFRLFLWVAFFSPAIIALLAIDREPLVAYNDEATFDDISDAKDILKRFDPRMMNATSTTTVTATDKELSMAIGAALSRFAPLKARIDAYGDDVAVQGTAQLPIPDTFLGRYLNVEAVVAESDTELVVKRVSLGDITLPGWLVKPVAIYMLDWFMGDGKGAPTYASIRSVDVDQGTIKVAFQPPANLVADVKAAAGRVIHLGNADAVRAYYAEIVEISARRSGKGAFSLSAYLGPLFTLAEKRSAAASPVDENRALILALAMYFGDSRFELLLRDVDTKGLNDGDFDAGEVKLERRHDWVQHFVTTAAIQVAAGSGLSNFIGEAKEIHDAEGPSGFSFTDIAADRTGVRFAEVATRSESSARRLQGALAGGAEEREFFPKVGDFPEGLSEAQFKAVYGDINTETYNAMIRVIDRRIEGIALYR